MKKRFGWLLSREAALGSALVFLALLGGFFALCYGSWQIDFASVVRVLMSKTGLAEGGVEPVESVIVWDGRLPRYLVAFSVGFSLAVAGAIMQGIFKNPMAEPGVIGISAGAALGAVGALYFGLASRSLLALPLSAIAVSLLTLMTVFLIATMRGHTSVATLLLTGIALNMIFGALTSFIIAMSTREFDVGRVIVTWLMGDLNNRSWEHVQIVLPTTALAVAGTLCFVKDLNILMIGEETAANLGVNIPLARNSLLFLSSVMTGGAIAVAGVIGFVGLVAPHIVRALIGPDNRKLVPIAGLMGAVFVIYADLFVRLVVKVDLKVGVLTSMLGGPFFLFLIVRHRRRFEYL
ncbi:MAG: iron ABC transporter permease [bacterium]